MSDDSENISSTAPSPVGREVQLAVVGLGITSIIAQIILLREFLSIFFGNELVIGVFLANWLILTGIGAFGGKFFDRLKSKTKTILCFTILIGLLPLLTVFCLRWLRNIVFIPGEMVDISRIAYTCFILLLPYCILSGAFFTLLVYTCHEKYKTLTLASLYSLESTGSVVGGLMFSFVMVYFFSTFQCLNYLLLFDLALVFFIASRFYYNGFKYFVLSAFIFAIVLSSLVDLDTLTRNMLFNRQPILSYADTPYGYSTVTGQEGQKNFFENSILLFSTSDVVSNEEAVHYAMIQHPQPKNVLSISGNMAGILQEVLKYNPDHVEYIDINPSLIESEKRLTSVPKDHRIHISVDDPRRFVKRTTDHYDVVLVNVSDPVNIALNRYYTVDFFRELKSTLNSGAIVSFGFLENVDYYSENARLLNSVMWNTLSLCFKNILIIPGTTKNYFLASDSTLDIHIAQKIHQRNIATDYVNQYYLDDELLTERSQTMKNGLIPGTAINEDFRPIAYYRHVAYWLSYFKTNYWIILIGLLIIMVPVIWKMNAINFGMLTGGFAGLSSEVILLLAFQIIYGYVYLASGFIITMFMAGLAIGSYSRKKIFKSDSMNSYTYIQLGVGLYFLILPNILVVLKNLNVAQSVVQMIFVLLILMISISIGVQFSIASSIQKAVGPLISSSIYSFDLIGSALGAVAVSIFFIPLFGIANACLLTAGASFTGGIVSFWKRKTY